MKFLKELVSKDRTTECFKKNNNSGAHSSTEFFFLNQRHELKGRGLT
jgi:hypothetical protein